MRATAWLTFAIAPAIAACNFGDDIVLTGEHHHYVVSKLRLPTNSTEAKSFSLDLNRDDVVDNQLGMVFGTLNGQGLGVGGTAQESLLRGGLIMLADLQTEAFDDAPIAGLTTFLGSDPDPAPCTDVDDLATCGRHLAGDATFTVDANTQSGLAVGAIVDRAFVASIGTMPVEIVVDTNPLRLDLRHARVRLTQIAEDRIEAVIAGGITATDVQNSVIREAATQIARIVSTECAQPSGQAPCGCVASSRAETLADLFDRDHNCEISFLEVAGHPLVQSLASTDLRIDDEDLLSFGLSVELVEARFESPVP